MSLKGTVSKWEGIYRSLDSDSEQNFEKITNKGGNSEAHKGIEQKIVWLEIWMWKWYQQVIDNGQIELNFEEGKGTLRN